MFINFFPSTQRFHRFGRKFTMVFCAVTSAVLSIGQSFSVNYPMFLILELLSSTVSSGIYTVTFVLGNTGFYNDIILNTYYRRLIERDETYAICLYKNIHYLHCYYVYIMTLFGL